MFNHECLKREGQVVGACMDGFLFGACCELPKGSTIGNFIQDEDLSINNLNNDLSTKQTVMTTRKTPTTPMFDINSGVSQITASLLNPSILPTAEDNQIFQIKDDKPFTSTGVTHQNTPETVIVNEEDNEIDPLYFNPSSTPTWDINKISSSTDRITPLVSISVSNAPLEYTTSSGFHRPMFHPKPSHTPDSNKYVLVPTISHNTSKPNETEYETVVSMVDRLNSTSPKPPSTSYVFSSLSSRRPGFEPISSIKPPSTLYISSSTMPNRRTESTTVKLPYTSYIFSTTIPTRRTESTTTKRTHKPVKTKPTKKTTPSYVYSLAPAKTTLAYSPDAFQTSVKPPSTSYVYSSQPSRRPLPSTVDSHVVGPGFTVSSSSLPIPAPTLIVLGPLPQETESPQLKPVTTYEQVSPIVQRPTTTPPLYKPSSVKPINHVTINNHITQNIYSTSERPSPTVLITPKPSISTSSKPIDDDTVEILSSGSADDSNNFPPDRNPNLNLSSINTISEEDITTPVFIEDEQLDKQVESFVNKLVQGLQEPFNGLRDVVYNKSNSTILSVRSTTVKPKQGTTTKKSSVAKPSSTKPLSSRPAATTVTAKPAVKPTAASSVNLRPSTTNKPVTTRRSTTRKPSTQLNVTKKQSTTTKKPRTTKKPSTTTTTTESYIESVQDNESLASIDPEDYKTRE